MINLEKSELYPLLFEPVYKQADWGGVKLRTVLGRPLTEDSPSLGEAWDICDQPDFSSVVSNGSLAGVTLRDLLARYGSDFAGKNYRGGAFPVAVKILDASKRMPLQVHPGENALTAAVGGEPETEMWYILQADRDARVFAGLRPEATRQAFLNLLDKPEIEATLQSFTSISGDAYFIPGGRVHSLGAGNLVLKISRNIDTAYRIYDWDRVGNDGEKRPLQVREAIGIMDFMDRAVPRICGASDSTDHNRKYPLINRCRFFQCDELMLVEDWHDSTATTASFHLLTALNTPFSVGKDTADDRVCVDYSASVLIPACYGEYRIFTEKDRETDIIRTTLK